MLQSVRIGFATNSSSTHSVILHSPKAGASAFKDAPLEVSTYDNDIYDQNFQLASPEGKLRFLMLANRHNINMSQHARMEMISAAHAAAAAHSIDIPKILDEIDGMLTSQSLDGGEVPKGIDPSLWFDFFITNPIVAYGYYDNNTAPYEGEEGDAGAHNIRESMVWKQDGNALVGFNKNNGFKLRWSRDPYTKSTTPELVDVKVTDHCSYGCEFCYQGSTKAGKHARLEDLEQIFDQLKEMNCFEIAVGGGEPVHHPQFAEIVRMAKSRGLTFNFTAYGTDWAKNDEILGALYGDSRFSKFGVGLSVHSSKDLVKETRIREALREKKLWGSPVTPQTVIGATPLSVTRELLEHCVENGKPLILLGFKRTGRGKDFQVSDAEKDQVRDLLAYAKKSMEDRGYEYDPFQLSVDTAFIDLYDDVLDDLEIPRLLRTSPEGAFSMYVDAVTMKAGPSSYCDPTLMRPVGDLKAQFATF